MGRNIEIFRKFRKLNSVKMGVFRVRSLSNVVYLSKSRLNDGMAFSLQLRGDRIILLMWSILFFMESPPRVWTVFKTLMENWFRSCVSLHRIPYSQV